MGSHAITYAVVALAIALACLLAGFFWGRSNVHAQIADAIEKEHVSLDAREFAMRTQLEDAIAENARLRPLAEELARVQKRLEQEQAKYARMRADFNASSGTAALDSSHSDEPAVQEPTSADEAIQKLLQSLEVFNDPDAEKAAVLPEAPKPEPKPVAPAAAIPAPTAPRAATPPAAQVNPVPKPLALPDFRPAAKPSRPAPVPPPPAPANPVPTAPAVTARIPTPPSPATAVTPKNPAPPPPARPAPQQGSKPGQSVDEWQEFARQLEALTGKKK